MPTSTIHPTTHNIFDGGSPVDLEHPCESTMSNNNKKKEYYNQTDFDEMIADVIEPAKRNRGRQQQHHATAHYDDEDQYQQNEYEQDSFSSSTDNDSEQYSSPQQQPRIMVDTLPTSTDSRSISDQEDEEVISLNSDDISGGSDISDMEQQRPKDDRNNNDNFTPRPLINDDESTVDMRPPAPINQSVSSYVEALNQQQMRKNRIVRFGALLILLGVIVGVVLGIVSVTNGGDDEGSSSSELNNGGGEGYGLESGQISVKESFVGNTTTNSPSLSPVYLDEDLLSPVTTVSLGGGSPTIPPQSAFPTKNPTLPPQSALPARDPTLAPVDVISTDAPVTVTNSPVTPDPTPEPTPSPMTYEPTFEPTSVLSPQPSQKPTYRITPPPTPNPTPYPTPKPFTITSPPTPRPTPRPTNAVIPPSPSGPTLPAGGGSPSDDTFHCAKVTYTSNWNELVDFDCSAPCSGLGMNSECPSGHQCRSDEGNCL